MSPLDHSSEVFHLDLGIDRRGVDRLVAEKLLHVPEPGASLKKMRRTGMAERVGMDTRHSRGLAVSTDHDADHNRAKALAFPRQEQRACSPGCRTRSGREASRYRSRALSASFVSGNKRSFLPFPQRTHTKLWCRSTSENIQTVAFTEPETASVENLEDRSVAKPVHRALIRRLENAPELLDRRDEPGKHFDSGNLEAGRRIAEAHASSVEEPKEASPFAL
jgi:hypothetical protein